MDKITNPFSPGAGSPPPELAGREDILEQAEVLLARVRRKRPEKSMLLTGLRGVGKTVLFNEMECMTQARDYRTILVEALEGKPLAVMLIPQLKRLLFELDRLAGAGRKVRRGIAVLKSFISAVRVAVGDVEFGLDIDSEPGAADSGDLEIDLPNVFKRTEPLLTVDLAGRLPPSDDAFNFEGLKSDLHALGRVFAFGHGNVRGKQPRAVLGFHIAHKPSDWWIGLGGPSRFSAHRVRIGPLDHHELLEQVIGGLFERELPQDKFSQEIDLLVGADSEIAFEPKRRKLRADFFISIVNLLKRVVIGVEAHAFGQLLIKPNAGHRERGFN